MQYLLILVLTLLPLNGHTADSMPSSTTGTDQNTTERSFTSQPSGDEYPAEQSWPYANPYRPTSATNFDPFTAPLAPRADTPGSINTVYGHFGDQLFPNSINTRGITDHPFAMDSPANLYGRDQRMRGR